MKTGIKERIKTVLQRTLLPAFYRRGLLGKYEKNKVIFSDCHHESCPYSMRYLYELMKKDDRFTVEEDFHDYSKGSFYGLKCSLSFMKKYAGAFCVVICDNHLPVASAKKRKETFVVQLWHSGGALKKFGYDSPLNIPESYRGGNVFGNYDLVAVSADYAVSAFESAMKAESGVVRAIGTSRSDHMFDEAYKESIRKKFFDEDPGRRGKKIILYAPTFRGHAGEAVTVGFQDVEEAGRSLPDDYILIKKPHPHDTAHSYTADSKLSSEELLIVCDLLITDYSSIIYDYSLLGKPLLLYIPDYAEYERENGFYEDFDSIPAVKVFTKDEIKDNIIRATEDFFDEKSDAFVNGGIPGKAAMEEFAGRTMAACDGNSSRRIMELIAERL